MRLQKITPRKLLIALGLFLLVLFLIWAGHLAYRVIHLTSTARSLAAAVQSQHIDSATLVSDLDSIAGDIGAIHANVRPIYPLLSLGAGIPGIGPYVRQVEPLLNLGNGMAQAGALLLDTFAPVMQASTLAGAGGTTTERLFTAIESNLPALDEASQLLDQVAPERQKIDPDLLPGSIRRYYLKADHYFPTLQKALPALKQVPALMGAKAVQNYLILAQNRDEMRATGGFISGIGLASLDKGKVSSFSLGDSYAIDDFSKGYPKPPVALKQFMEADYWVTRDANWSPDFPTAARQAEKLYKLSTGTQVGGTIAFDQLAVKSLLEVLGPVTLEGYPDPISAANVEDFMRLSWAPDPSTGITPEWWANRKKFMGDLGKVILGKIFTPGDSKALAALALKLVDLVQTGHLLVYVDQPEIASLLAEANLDGALRPTAGDYLYLVDSNVGYNKVDTIINRQLLYEVDLSDPANPTANITVSYQHTGQQDVICKQEATYGKGTYADMQARCYWDYWRIYLPTGSRVITAAINPVSGAQLLSGKDWPGQVETNPGEANLTVLSGIMVLPTKSQQQTSIQISLPSTILQKGENQEEIFQLQVPKQPGLADLPVKVSIKLPANSAIQPGNTDFQKESIDTWSWNGDITTTRLLFIAFNPAAANK